MTLTTFEFLLDGIEQRGALTLVTLDSLRRNEKGIKTLVFSLPSCDWILFCLSVAISLHGLDQVSRSTQKF